MQFQNNVKENDYLITPDGFINYTEQWKQQALVWIKSDEEFEKQALKNNRKNQIKNIREGALYFRIKRLI